DDFGIVAVGGNLALSSTTLELDFSLLGANGPDGSNNFWNSDRTWKIVDVATNNGSTNFSSIVDAVFASGSFSTSLGTGGDLGDIFLHFTSTGTPLVPGDFNGDGNVDGADFVI